jgi:hypothetical protein
MLLHVGGEHPLHLLPHQPRSSLLHTTPLPHRHPSPLPPCLLVPPGLR